MVTDDEDYLSELPFFLSNGCSEEKNCWTCSSLGKIKNTDSKTRFKGENSKIIK